MTSQINPTAINDQYPVAGQPNNTQGFRDNFAGTKTNFEYAAEEITELQTKSILNAALDNGSALTTQNNMLGAPLIGAKIRNFSADSVNIATTSGPITLDYSQGHYQRIATTGNISLGFSNFAPSGSLSSLRVQTIIDAAGRTMTLSPYVTLGTTGIQGYANSTITFAEAGTYQFGFTTSDSGATITIEDLNRPLSTFTNTISANSIASSGSIKSSSSTGGVGYATGAGGTVSQSTITLSGVVISGTGGTFTCTAASKTLVVGDVLTISGTYGGGGSISGYSDPTSYYIIATNGSTTFTLSTALGGSAITTTAGTPTGLTYTVNSKTHSVTLNRVCGQITTNSALLAAGAETSFTLTNSTIAATDVVFACIASGATAGAYNVQVDAVAAGSCRISIGNMSSGSLSESLVLNFAVVKAVSS